MLTVALLGGSCSGSDDPKARIAFWSDAEADSSIFLATADGAEVSRLTSGWKSSWSPDGDQLVFVDGIDDLDSDLYVINGDGTGRARVVRDGNEPVWSPDGRRIAFLRWVRDESMDIHVADLERGTERRLTSEGRFDGSPSWSPDGTTLVFSRRDIGVGFAPEEDRTSIFAIRADGNGLRQLTEPGRGVLDEWPVWSPSGDEIVFHRSLIRGSDGQVADQELFVVASDGSRVRQLTRGPGFACCPSWTAEGDKVVFTRHMGAAGRWFIHVVDRDGTGTQRLSRSGVDSDASWSQDGRLIVFLSGRDDPPDFSFEQVYVMNADGSHQRRVSRTGTSDMSPLFMP